MNVFSHQTMNDAIWLCDLVRFIEAATLEQNQLAERWNLRDAERSAFQIFLLSTRARSGGLCNVSFVRSGTAQATTSTQANLSLSVPQCFHCCLSELHVVMIWTFGLNGRASEVDLKQYSERNAVNNVEACAFLFVRSFENKKISCFNPLNPLLP